MLLGLGLLHFIVTVHDIFEDVEVCRHAKVTTTATATSLLYCYHGNHARCRVEGRCLQLHAIRQSMHRLVVWGKRMLVRSAKKSWALNLNQKAQASKKSQYNLASEQILGERIGALLL